MYVMRAYLAKSKAAVAEKHCWAILTRQNSSATLLGNTATMAVEMKRIKNNLWSECLVSLFGST